MPKTIKAHQQQKNHKQKIKGKGKKKVDLPQG
jgi:hypothetical protein